MEDVAKNLAKGIIPRIHSLRKNIEKSLPLIQKEVDEIISKKVTSISRIEKTLDTLLNFAPLGYGAEEFKELNNYYRTINKKNSKTYASFFEDELTGLL